VHAYRVTETRTKEARCAACLSPRERVPIVSDARHRVRHCIGTAQRERRQRSAPGNPTPHCARGRGQPDDSSGARRPSRERRRQRRDVVARSDERVRFFFRGLQIRQLGAPRNLVGAASPTDGTLGALPGTLAAGRFGIIGFGVGGYAVLGAGTFKVVRTDDMLEDGLDAGVAGGRALRLAARDARGGTSEAQESALVLGDEAAVGSQMAGLREGRAARDALSVARGPRQHAHVSRTSRPMPSSTAQASRYTSVGGHSDPRKPGPEFDEEVRLIAEAV